MLLPLLKRYYGLTEPLVPLSGGRVNRLWRSGEWVVKQYDHMTVPTERAREAITLMYAAADAGLPVPKPQPPFGGGLWVEHEGGLIAVMPYCAALRWERGRLSVGEAAHLGRFVARLHAVLREIRPCLSAPQPPSDAVLRWSDLATQVYTERHEMDRLVLEFSEYVRAASVPVADWGNLGWQMCHSDLHLDNLLFGSGGEVAGLFDFDNARPWWTGLEVMMVWNLCLCEDPGQPIWSPQADSFFQAYAADSGRSKTWLAGLPTAYWHFLTANTWPAALYVKDPAQVTSDWVELLRLRLRSARWLERHLDLLRL